jgi:hypothetical protein
MSIIDKIFEINIIEILDSKYDIDQSENNILNYTRNINFIKRLFINLEYNETKNIKFILLLKSMRLE